MADGDAAEAADRWEREARLRQQFEKECFTPFPWFDATRPYAFSFFTEEQLRVLDGREWRWARSPVLLEEFLRRHRN